MYVTNVCSKYVGLNVFLFCNQKVLSLKSYADRGIGAFPVK